jgi:hypothetical protein
LGSSDAAVVAAAAAAAAVVLSASHARTASVASQPSMTGICSHHNAYIYMHTYMHTYVL